VLVQRKRRRRVTNVLLLEKLLEAAVHALLLGRRSAARVEHVLVGVVREAERRAVHALERLYGGAVRRGSVAHVEVGLGLSIGASRRCGGSLLGSLLQLLLLLPEHDLVLQ